MWTQVSLQFKVSRYQAYFGGPIMLVYTLSSFESVPTIRVRYLWFRFGGGVHVVFLDNLREKYTNG